MVREHHGWFDEDVDWHPADLEDAGGVAVQTLSKSHMAENKEIQPLPSPSNKHKAHLAGADWLKDWARYLPSQTNRQ